VSFDAFVNAGDPTDGAYIRRGNRETTLNRDEG
ncbi:uncharacterized protein METZ01_LOCUS386647, partial [marine metagenome]